MKLLKVVATDGHRIRTELQKYPHTCLGDRGMRTTETLWRSIEDMWSCVHAMLSKTVELSRVRV